MQASIHLSRWHFQKKLNESSVNVWAQKGSRPGDQKKRNWNWAEKLSACDTSHEALWLASARGRVWAITVKHWEYLLAWFTEPRSVMVNAVLQGRGCCRGWLSQATTGCVYAWLSACPYLSSLLMCAFGCAVQASEKKNKKNCGYIFCSVSVSRCRDSTPVTLRSFISSTVTAETLLLLFPINDWFYV